MANDFVKGASGPETVYDTSPSGLGLSPAWLAPGAPASSGHAYTTYTPAWTATGTQPAIGNGTLVGQSVQVGKLVHFYIQLVAGSTTTFGTGTYAFSVPVASISGLTGVPIGWVWSTDGSGAVYNIAAAVWATTTTFTVNYPATWPTGVLAQYGQTVPWTWAVSDFIEVSGIYEAA